MLEYDLLSSRDTTKDDLNKMASNGWRLSHITPARSSSYDGREIFYYVMERQKKTEHEFSWRGKKRDEITWNDLCDIAEYLANNY
jgi:hypothetical protein